MKISPRIRLLFMMQVPFRNCAANYYREILFSFCPNVKFDWARGANARAGTQGKRGNSLRSHSPLSLGSLPRAPSFLILSPLKSKPCVRHAESAKSSVHSSRGSSERRTPSNAYPANGDTSNSNTRQAAYAKRETYALGGKGMRKWELEGKN